MQNDIERQRGQRSGWGWVASLALCAGCASSPALYERKLVDLTQTFRASTPNWPGEAPFIYRRLAGPGDDGRWRATGTLEGPEHSGTQLEAPMHYAEGRSGADEVPLHQLVGPIRLLDVEDACSRTPNYVVTLGDLRAHERDHGRVPAGAVVLIHTGWDKHWESPERYFGTLDAPHHPGLSVELAQALVARRVDLVGIDAPSLDAAGDRGLPVQRLLAGANIPGLENLTGLGLLPPLGATLIALPMKVERAGGAPTRVVAIVP